MWMMATASHTQLLNFPGTDQRQRFGACPNLRHSRDAHDDTCCGADLAVGVGDEASHVGGRGCGDDSHAAGRQCICKALPPLSILAPPHSRCEVPLCQQLQPHVLPQHSTYSRTKLERGVREQQQACWSHPPMCKFRPVPLSPGSRARSGVFMRQSDCLDWCLHDETVTHSMRPSISLADEHGPISCSPCSPRTFINEHSKDCWLLAVCLSMFCSLHDVLNGYLKEEIECLLQKDGALWVYQEFELINYKSCWQVVMSRLQFQRPQELQHSLEPSSFSNLPRTPHFLLISIIQLLPNRPLPNPPPPPRAILQGKQMCTHCQQSLCLSGSSKKCKLKL